MPNYCTYPQALELFEAVDQAKQDTLIAGVGISIAPDGKTISAPSGTGDMLKSVYDTDNDGIVDKAETLNDGANALSATIPELNYVHGVTGSIQTQLNGKQGTLTFDNVPTKNSANPVKSGGVYDAVGAKASISLLDDTVGWVGKNLLPYPKGTREFINGEGVISGNSKLLFSDYIDISGINSLTFSASAQTGTTYCRLAFYNSSKVFLSRPMQEITSQNLVYTVSVPLNAKYVRADIDDSDESGSGRLTNPMLRDASITDSTYEPYHAPVSEWGYTREEASVLGAKQWFNTKDLRNSDGVTIVTANKKVRIQNATASSWFGRFFYISVRPNTDYLYTVDVAVTSGKGCVSVKKDSDGTDIVAEINITSNGRQTFAFNSGSETTVRLGYYSTCGTSETGDISYDNILITLAGDTDRTWVDFAMTNQQLTRARVQSATFSGTTTANGNIKLYTGTDRMILNAMTDYSANQCVVDTFWGASNEVWGHVRIPDSSGGVRANASVSGVYYYVQI